MSWFSPRGGSYRPWLLAAAFVYASAVFHAAGAGQQPAPADPGAYKSLPEGPGKAALIRMCSICHELERVLAVRQTPQGWAAILENMSQRGAAGTDEEWDALFEYLSQHFTPQAGQAATPTAAAAPTTTPSLDRAKVRSTFTTSETGGRIELLAVELTDAATVLEIRSQLHAAVKRFNGGDFTAPPFVDAHRKPSVDAWQPFAAQIKYDVEERAGGGVLLIRGSAADAIAAIQRVLRAQQPLDR